MASESPDLSVQYIRSGQNPSSHNGTPLRTASNGEDSDTDIGSYVSLQ